MEEVHVIKPLPYSQRPRKLARYCFQNSALSPPRMFSGYCYYFEPLCTVMNKGNFAFFLDGWEYPRWFRKTLPNRVLCAIAEYCVSMVGKKRELTSYKYRCLQIVSIEVDFNSFPGVRTNTLHPHLEGTRYQCDHAPNILNNWRFRQD